MRPIHLELEIDYREADGSCSTRRITVKQFGWQEEGRQLLLGAHCSLSQRFTEFHGDRVVRCVDLEGGAPVEDLPGWLAERYARSRQGRLERLQDDLADELTVLLTRGRADRLLQRAEKELIAAYLGGRQPRVAGAEPLSEADIAAQLRWIDQPSAERFEAAVAALALGDRECLEPLFALCVALADVRAAREGEEQSALDRLQASWFGGDRGSAAADCTGA